MLTGNRVIFSDNGTISDLSRDLNDLYAGNVLLPVTFDQDKLYIGSDAAFNSRFLMVQTPNDVASNISVEIWTGSSWVPAVDVIDDTSVGGVALARSGVLQWTKDKNKSWSRVADSNSVTGLYGTAVYNMYWARLTFSASLKVTTSLRYVGQRFSNDNQLGGYYPDLLRSSVLAAFKTGKTNWEEQHVLASEELVLELRQRNLLYSGSQILDWQKYSLAATYKTAAIIMGGFGDDWADRRDNAEDKFIDNLEKAGVGIDRNEDGALAVAEQKNSVGLFRA